MIQRHHRPRLCYLVGAPLLILLCFVGETRGTDQVDESTDLLTPSSAETAAPPAVDHQAWAPEDLRSTAWLIYTCSNSLGRRDITLFANGTIRLREGLWESQAIYLHEMGPEELKEERRLLAGVFDPDTESRFEVPLGAVDGEWVERCEVVLELPDRQPLTYRFGQFEVPPLQVARLVQIAEDLAVLTRPLDPVERLSPSYKPSPGDTLINGEGERFVVIGLTADGGGVEVEALAAPMRIFHPLESLPALFVGYEPRGR